VHGTIESGSKVELKRLDEVAAFASDLRDLAARALSPNVFYEPAFVAAAASVFGRDVVAGLVRRRASGRLVGFFPVAIERRRYGLPMPMLVGWTHSFGPLGTPLIDRDDGAAVVTAWFDHIATDPTLPKLMLMPYLPADGDIAQAFDAALAHRNGRSEHFALHRRALLAPTDERAGYLDQAIPHKKRKDLRRLRKRLSDAGKLASAITSEPQALAAALADFLTLEASGWKGRAGTAAQANEELHRFMIQAVSTLAAEGKASVARLALDDRAIAAIVTLRSGDTAWCWKIAYDESQSRASPGVQLLLDVTGALLADTSIARADSCATADHPMIDHIWRERLALSDRLICVAKCDPTLFAHLCRLEQLRRSVIDTLKRLRHLVRWA
jgi:CelD/BcsL family acetyltransferase involved in cellulose biosynthesis